MLRTQPAGEDGLQPKAAATKDDFEGADGFSPMTDEDGDDRPSEQDFLRIVSDAEQQAQLYSNQVNRKSWTRSYRAYQQQHFVGSKYSSPEYANRSKLFVPKTRAAVRKDLAALSASLFGSIDAVTCVPGNEADPRQKASAAVVQELVNYRTDRSSGKASIPWFHVALGARQTSLLTGICLSKQYWKLELRKSGTEKAFHDDGTTPMVDEETGEHMERDVFKPHIDRPDICLFPPENFSIDPAADWTNPAQDAAYILLKYPMRIDEIRSKQNDPRNPWRNLSDTQLRGAIQAKANMDQASIRRSREQGLDRYDETQTGQQFDVLWVYETFVRVGGTDWTYFSIGSQHLLTDPKPVEEVYPEQFGERPLVMGYGAFEAFRIFPMSAVESWSMLQMESNDLRNLVLDALKQNVMPVTKVRRGRSIDLDQLKRRGQGSAIMVNDKDDVTWERPPEPPATAHAMKQMLDIEFDDLAGQQNYGTVADNNALGKTLGGLKLAAGAANAVQEFDQRVFIETWCEPVLAQLVRLEQYYESDPVILGLCGDRAQLMVKYGINEIDDELIENEVAIRVNIGLGAGDPQQRLAKFQMAAQVVGPVLQQSPEFLSGKKEFDTEAIMAEVFGAVGYRDGGRRFVKAGNPQPNPKVDVEVDKLKSEAERNRMTAKASLLSALASMGKVGIEDKKADHDIAVGQGEHQLAHIEALLGISDRVMQAQDMGNRHASEQISRQDQRKKDEFAQQQQKDGAKESARQFDARLEADREAARMKNAGGTGGGGAAPEPAGAGPKALPAPPGAAPTDGPKTRQIRNIKRDPRTNRIIGFDVNEAA